MCLDIKWYSIPRIARKDIVVYKRLRYSSFLKAYITPYQHFDIKIGEEYTSRLERDSNTIYAGIHSFETLHDAWVDGGPFFAECIIPKGAKYYKGSFCGLTSFASSKLKYLEIVEYDR